MLSNQALAYADESFPYETVSGFSRVLNRSETSKEHDRTGADVIKVESILARSKTGNKYPVWKFCKNSAPLSALVQFEDGHWFAELEWLNVIGEGASPQKAISDLESHIEYFVDFYRQKSAEELTPFAFELKNRFAQLALSR